MNLNLGVKLAVAGAMLTASLAASALQPTVPTQPPIIPAAGLTFGGTTDPLYVTVFDPLTGASLTEYLGLNASQITPGNMPGTPTMDFGTLTGFSTFDPTGSVSNLVYEVFSTSVSNGGNTNTVFTTSRNAASNALFDASATNGGAAGAIPVAWASINDWTTNRMNAANTCAKANPCFGVDFNDPKSFALVNNYADNYGGGLSGYGAAAHSAGSVGTSMNFYMLTADNTDPFAPITSDTKYPGVWTLSTAGDLTYAAAAVPLPAAAWLLLSGLASLGAIGRRRSVAVVAA